MKSRRPLKGSFTSRKSPTRTVTRSVTPATAKLARSRTTHTGSDSTATILAFGKTRPAASAKRPVPAPQSTTWANAPPFSTSTCAFRIIVLTIPFGVKVWPCRRRSIAFRNLQKLSPRGSLPLAMAIRNRSTSCLSVHGLIPATTAASSGDRADSRPSKASATERSSGWGCGFIFLGIILLGVPNLGSPCF